MRITRLRSFMSRDANRPRVVVAIDTDEGITGWGECYNHGPDRALPPLLDYLFTQIAGEDPRRIEFLILKLLQQARFPPGALGPRGHLGHRPLPAGTSRPRRWACRSTGSSAARSATRCGSMPASTPRPIPPRPATSSAALNERYGLTAFKLSPFRGDLHAAALGRGRAARSADYFAQAARDLARATTSSPSTPTPRSSSRGRRSSSATRSRPTTRSSSRSRSGPSTSRPGPS